MKTSHGFSHSTCRYLISHKKREKHGGGDDKRETIHLLLNFISVKEFFAFAQGRIFHLAYFNYIFLNHAIPSLFSFSVSWKYSPLCLETANMLID